LADVVAAFDPNSIDIPSGLGPQDFVEPSGTFPYSVNFENEATATAPAQSVTVTEQLDPNLDWSTFQFGDFGFGTTVVPVPPGRTSFSTRVDATATLGVFVDVSASFILQTGLITWTFTSLDPRTLDLPIDPLAGFLPPNTNAPAGQGFVTYTVNPRTALTTGTKINAQATVVFDNNAPIDTALRFNTVDSGVPTSSVNPLPATTPTTNFTVSWSGSDDKGGAGIASYDVYVSDNSRAFRPFVTDTTQTSATFNGVNGHTCGFYSVATDNVGNRQTTPTAPQATTTVAAPVTSGSITGVVFLDYNADGVRSPGEPALAGRTVYLDLNGNGALDPGEPTATTAADGSYALPNLAPGTYTVREVHPFPNELDTGSRGGAYTAVVTTGSTEIDLGNLSYSPAFPTVPTADLYGPHINDNLGTAFIKGLCHTVLGRDGEASGIAAWYSALATGMTREEIAWDFVNSTEHRRQQVDAYYRAFLGCSAYPDAASGHWVGLLQADGDEAEVIRGILTSAEYAAKHAGDAAFVGDMYFRLLGRSEGTADGAYWEKQLAAGVSRADGFLQSREAAVLLEESCYASFLHRPSDPLRQFWIGALTGGGLSYGQVAAGILSSPEFFLHGGEDVP
jgi:hypothetical protein